MPSVDETVGQIMTADVPVLFIDTCILLDIVRAPHRCLPDCASRASELLRLVTISPPACVVVVSSIIRHEWTANVQKVTEETVRHLERMEEHSSHFHDACQAVGVMLPFGMATYAQWGLAARLRDLSEQLLDIATCLDADAGCRVRAFDRVVNKIPPSEKSGEVKDSAIIEEYLAVCRGLQAAGLTRKRVFCTSNTADYCEANGRPHSVLRAEFDACGLTFTANLPWALHELTH